MPSQIKTPFDNVLIDNAIGFPKEPSYDQQEENQKKYEENKSNLQVDDFVYTSFTHGPLSKSFDTKKSQIYQIAEVGITNCFFLIVIFNLSDPRRLTHISNQQCIESKT